MKRKILAIGSMAIILSGFAFDASAIPAFARKNNMPCTGCHTAVPTLNATGRAYKENGFKFSAEEKAQLRLGDNVAIDNVFPMSIGIVARPYDKKDTGTTNNRAIHEFELFVGGEIADNVSGFAEIEAEDETGFNAEFVHGEMTFELSPEMNFQVSHAAPFAFDPYDTLSDGRRMTRGHNVVLDKVAGGADAALRRQRQNVTLFGRVADRFFYGFSYSGPAKDTEGHDANTVSGRVAFDVTPNIMIGGLFMNGTCTVDSGSANCATQDRDYTRTGLDFQADVNDFRFTGAWLKATDDNATGTSDMDTEGYYLRAMYLNRSSGKLTWVPLIRYDNYDKNGGLENIDEWTLQLNYYFKDNIKGMIEYWDRSGDGTTADDNRLTIQLYGYF